MPGIFCFWLRPYYCNPGKKTHGQRKQPPKVLHSKRHTLSRQTSLPYGNTLSSWLFMTFSLCVECHCAPESSKEDRKHLPKSEHFIRNSSQYYTEGRKEKLLFKMFKCKAPFLCLDDVKFLHGWEFRQTGC